MGVGKIDVGVVGQNVDGDSRVFVRAARIGNGDRAVVGAANGKCHRGPVRIHMAVRNAVLEAVGRRFAKGKGLEFGNCGRVVANIAVGIQGNAGARNADWRNVADNQNVAGVGVFVVAQNVGCGDCCRAIFIG